MDLAEIRARLDEVDSRLIDLFCQRLALAEEVGAQKKETGTPILDPAREREKTAALMEQAGAANPDAVDYVPILCSLLFEMSRAQQEKIVRPSSQTSREIEAAIQNTPQLFPQNAVIACQGVEGAYSQLACERLFPTPNIMYFRDFEGVFAAIDGGLCRYGVLPLENSTAGSVNQIYDLMMRYNFRIVRSARLKVDHNLLAKRGTKLSDIREIVSHEQAISQCTAFLQSLGNVKVTVCENTAIAAQTVAASDRTDLAALSSRACAELYGLANLAGSVQDKGNNYTRFICISKDLEIYPGADRTSIMLTLPHKPGALYKILARFYALGINLVKLESRPLPDRDFEFMFYFDLETTIYSPKFVQLMSNLETLCEEMRYLGSYLEIV